MKITKSRLKQIVEEETKKILAEQFPAGVDPSTYAGVQAARAPGRVSPTKMSKAKRDELIARNQAAKDKKDDEILAKRAKEREQEKTASDWEKEQAMRDSPGEFSRAPDAGATQMSINTLDPDVEYAYQRQADAEFYDPASPTSASGRFGRKHAETPAEKGLEVDDEARAALGFADELGQDIPDFMRAQEQPEKKKKSRSRVASGGKLTGRKLNRMRDRGEIDQATWLKARRALANKGQGAARLALGPAADTPGKTKRTRTADLATGRSKGRGDQDTYNDAIDQASADAAAPEQPALAAVDTETIDRLTREVNDIKNARKASDLLPATWKEYKELAKKYQTSYGMSKKESYEAARGALSSKKLNQIARLRNEPARARMVANRKRRADKNRAAAAEFGGGGRDLASVRNQSRSNQATAAGGAPGDTLEESKYLQIVREELQNVLNENVAKDPEVAALIKKVAATGFATVPQLEKTVAGRDKKTVTNWLTSKLTKKVAKKDPAVELKNWKARCKGTEQSDICKRMITKWTEAVKKTQYAAGGPPKE